MLACSGFIIIPYNDIMRQAVGCWRTVHCGAALPCLVLLAVSCEFLLSKRKMHGVGETDYSSQEPPLLHV